MRISHHPPEELLADFAIGALEEAEQLVIAVHLSGCPQCSRFVRSMEQLTAADLEVTQTDLPPGGGFASILGKIGAQPQTPPRIVPQASGLPDPVLPDLLRSYDIGKRRRVAPGLSQRPIHLPLQGQARAFLLEAAPGTRMLEHSHSGTELTCVLTGSFSHQDGRFGPGDFDYGDDDATHRIVIGDEEPCICLIAMTGELRLSGLLGRLIGPFVRL